MGADFQKLGIYHHDEFLEAAAAAKRGPEAPEPAQEQVAAAEEPVQVASAVEEVAEAGWFWCRFFRNCSEHAYLYLSKSSLRAHSCFFFLCFSRFSHIFANAFLTFFAFRALHVAMSWPFSVCRWWPTAVLVRETCNYGT